MKKFLVLLACAAFIGGASAQTSATTTTDLTEHICSASCTKEAHTYLHGEKGHSCTEACATAATTEVKAAGCCAGKKASASCANGAKAEGHAHAHGEGHTTKEHACTTACADGKHAYACGEKGHACGASCSHAH